MKPSTRPGRRWRARLPFFAVALLLTGLLGACSGGEPGAAHREALPVQDGARFVYERVYPGGSEVRQRETLRITALDEGRLRFRRRVTTWHVRRPDSRDESVQADYVLDASGFVVRPFDPSEAFGGLGESQVQGRLVQLWLPTADRSAGASVPLTGFPDDLPVGERTGWRRWTVWPAEYGGHRYYFDVDTGFLVGREWERQTWVLEESSVSGL